MKPFARDETFEYKGYASGAVDYLIKPINDEILKSKVEVFLTLYQERVRLKVALKARTQAEQELNLHKEHLEELVEERTLELQESVQHQLKIQRQLIESEKMASLGRLVAGISHELNTPIGVSLTAATYLSKETDEINKAFLEDRIQKDCFIDYVDCAKQTTDILSSNLNRAKELIKNFKLVTVDVSSEMPRSFNVQEYIRTVVQSLKPEIKQTKHQIEIVGEQELIVESYPGTISQILTNLVMNSLLHAYTDEEQGHILISADKEDDMVCLTYRDDGKGMSPDIMVKVFDPFFTTRRGSGGSGLGMHILHNLVTQTLGGDVICSSEVGKGTTFKIHFPLNISKIGTD